MGCDGQQSAADGAVCTPRAKTLLNDDMAQACRISLDDLCLDEIDGSSGQLTLSQGALTVPDALRAAKGDIMAQGFNPDLVLMNDADGEVFDTLKDSNEHYLFPEGGGVWGMSRVISTQIPAGTAYVLNRSAVTVFTSPLSVEADFSLHFTTNRAVLRVEGLALCVVRQGAGTLKLTLA